MRSENDPNAPQTLTTATDCLTNRPLKRVRENTSGLAGALLRPARRKVNRMHPYALGLQVTLTAHADPDEAAPMRAYMRDQFQFLGIKTPKRRDLIKLFIAVHRLPNLPELDTVVRNLWALREYSKTDPQAVRDFVAQTRLHPLSAREALKWLERRE